MPDQLRATDYEPGDRVIGEADGERLFGVEPPRSSIPASPDAWTNELDPHTPEGDAMPLFTTLMPLEKRKAETLADALYTDGMCGTRVDLDGATILWISSDKKPYSVDFFCVTDTVSRLPQPMSPAEQTVLWKWTNHAVKRICKAWQQRHPDGPRRKDGPVVGQPVEGEQ